MMKGVLKSAGKDLFVEMDGNEFPLGICERHVFGHCNILVLWVSDETSF